ncbi:MAG: aminopeptidase P family protein [Clostridium sp.]|uniref:aminopeptidase P family protein n=1 Tax=Clostridium sp. TaxID=1506 RepID=UPI002906A209|nr:aminopeptidase P family protein [Clostridium sp.]MDU4937395.1 aminopeptidase P family protein [Clostridium sp.]
MSNLNNLREVMKKENVDYYIIPSGDSHQSEYVPEYYKGRAYVSGFTGSAGTLLVGIEESYLWTDGRYFIQAEKELNGSGIKLMKMNIPGYPSLIEWIKNNVKEGKTLAFDGSTISANEYKNYKELAEKNGFNIKMEKDLLNLIWNNRPELSKEKIFIHDAKYCGKSTSEKLEEVRSEMTTLEGENYVVTSLDDIAWLFNIRGNDIAYNPVALAYALISDKEAVLYINEEKVTNDDKRTLEAQGVTLKPYNDIYEDIKNVTASIIIDGAKVNGKLYSLISEDVKIIENLNITTSLKAVKNEVEIKNMEVSQVRDGVAMVKFIKWLKENVGKINMTEISASDKLEEIRAKGENFKGLSFNTIAGYKDHAAMMHYSATEESQYELNSEGMLLIDSGAQYLDGTTDITRTFILGPITEEEKRDFTLVLKSHIALATTIFLKGTNGCNLDAIARRPLWKYGMDYKCGTGHGVGFFLNVHEGPQGIRPFGNTIALEPGMILTNEPGVYKENKHGIRTENTLLVTKAFKNDEMGEFYKFDTISYCPIDLEGIDVSLLDEEEREWLNNYHRTVYEKLSPYLTEEEKKFLEKETRSI